MYSRYPNYRFGGGIKIPENYSGNAFSDPPSPIAEQGTAEDLPTPETTELEAVQTAVSPDDAKSESAGVLHHKKRLPFGFNFNLGRLFSGGFGFEEMLIIALILLVSQNDSGDDLILFLALLLFIG